MSKYRAIRTNGYASKREARRANNLAILERAGEITELKEQVVFIIAPSVVIQGRKRPPMKYIADWTYVQGGNLVVEDCKGFRTTEYKIKRHLMKAVHNIDITET